MIKIKDYIFNGNEIKMFVDGERIKVVFKNDTHIYIDATYEDIEWNYGGVFEIMSEEEQLRQNSENDKDKILELRNDLIDKLQNQIKELEEKNKTFEDYNKDLNNQLDKLEEDLDAEKSINANLSRRILKTLEILESKKHCERLCGGVDGKTFTEQAIEKLKGEENE